MNTLQTIINAANKAGFTEYGSFNEGELQHDILTCTKGKYSGEVIDIYYFYETGKVTSALVSTQFKGQEPMFNIPIN